MGIMENILKGSTVGEAAQSVGSPVVPITQAGASAVGATNPDSVKMVGTPNQKLSSIQNALKLSSDAESSITGTQIRQPKLSASAEEKLRQEKAQKLARVGDVDDRLAKVVGEKAEANQQQAVAGALAKSSVVNAVAVAKLAIPEADKVSLTTALTALIKDPTNVAALNTVQTLTKLSSVKDIQSTLMKTDTAAVAATFADSIPSTVTLGVLGQDDWESLGFVNSTDAASTLGIPTDQLSGMTFKQFQETVAELKRSGYSTTSDLQQEMSDPTIGASSRAEILRELRQRGVIGADAADALVGDIEGQITNGVEVSINGTVVSIADMLSNDEIKSQLKDLLDNPDALAKLDDTDPFKKWFTQNEAALTARLGALTDTDKVLIGNRKSSTEASTFGVTKVDDSTMKLLVPGWAADPLKSADTTGASSLYKYLKDPATSEDARQYLLSQLNTLSTQDPSLAKELTSIPADSLLMKQITADHSILENLKAYKTKVNAISAFLNPAYGEGGKKAALGMVYGDPNIGDRLLAAKTDPAKVYPDAASLPLSLQAVFKSQFDKETAGASVDMSAFLSGPTSLAGLANGQKFPTVPANPMAAVDEAATRITNEIKSKLTTVNTQSSAFLSANTPATFSSALSILSDGSNSAYLNKDNTNPGLLSILKGDASAGSKALMSIPIVARAFADIDKGIPSQQGRATLLTVLGYYSRVLGISQDVAQRIPGLMQIITNKVNAENADMQKTKAKRAAEIKAKADKASGSRGSKA